MLFLKEMPTSALIESILLQNIITTFLETNWGTYSLLTNAFCTVLWWAASFGRDPSTSSIPVWHGTTLQETAEGLSPEQLLAIFKHGGIDLDNAQHAANFASGAAFLYYPALSMEPLTRRIPKRIHFPPSFTVRSKFGGDSNIISLHRLLENLVEIFPTAHPYLFDALATCYLVLEPSRAFQTYELGIAQYKDLLFTNSLYKYPMVPKRWMVGRLMAQEGALRIAGDREGSKGAHERAVEEADGQGLDFLVQRLIDEEELDRAEGFCLKRLAIKTSDTKSSGAEFVRGIYKNLLEIQRARRDWDAGLDSVQAMLDFSSSRKFPGYQKELFEELALETILSILSSLKPNNEIVDTPISERIRRLLLSIIATPVLPQSSNNCMPKNVISREIVKLYLRTKQYSAVREIYIALGLDQSTEPGPIPISNGDLCLLMRDYESAIEFYSRAHLNLSRIHPNPFCYALAQCQEGDMPQAVRILRRAVQADTDEDEAAQGTIATRVDENLLIKTLLAHIYEQIGDGMRADRYWKSAESRGRSLGFGLPDAELSVGNISLISPRYFAMKARGLQLYAFVLERAGGDEHAVNKTRESARDLLKRTVRYSGEVGGELDLKEGLM